jgi:hypothetical protein
MHTTAVAGGNHVLRTQLVYFCCGSNEKEDGGTGGENIEHEDIGDAGWPPPLRRAR